MTIANAVGFCDEEWQLGIGGPSVAMLSPAASTPPPSNADLHEMAPRYGLNLQPSRCWPRL